VASKNPKKKSALAAAASRKLQGIGPKPMSPEDLVHALMHAEERGEVERTTFPDGSVGWLTRGPDGKVQALKATPEMLAALHKFETEGHPAH
jgi:hypothetical protein